MPNKKPNIKEIDLIYMAKTSWLVEENEISADLICCLVQELNLPFSYKRDIMHLHKKRCAICYTTVYINKYN
jgi:hypothetical protein